MTTSVVRGSDDPLLLIGHTGASGNPALWFQQDGEPKAYVWWDQANSRLNLGTRATNPIVSFQNDGDVGIGTTSPGAQLHVLGSNDAIKGASANGTGVVGISQRPGTGTTFGGAGVHGENNLSGGLGVTGRADLGEGVQGASISGTGVHGFSRDRAGVAGVGGLFGVDGFSSNGTGVRGRSNDGTGVAGFAGAASPAVLIQGAGVFGAGTIGVYGAGVYGGLAGQFVGNVDITGSLNVTGPINKLGGGFKIDRPLDPANKCLSHSFVESPDMKNVYDGVTTLDERGEAVVELPVWFETLNRGFRYQLTAIGGPAPSLHVAEEVAGNRFRIAGGRGGIKVSWMLTGIRQDAWANANRIPVESAKPDKERGT